MMSRHAAAIHVKRFIIRKIEELPDASSEAITNSLNEFATRPGFIRTFYNAEKELFVSGKPRTAEFVVEEETGIRVRHVAAGKSIPSYKLKTEMSRQILGTREIKVFDIETSPNPDYPRSLSGTEMFREARDSREFNQFYDKPFDMETHTRALMYLRTRDRKYLEPVKVQQVDIKDDFAKHATGL